MKNTSTLDAKPDSRFRGVQNACRDMFGRQAAFDGIEILKFISVEAGNAVLRSAPDIPILILNEATDGRMTQPVDGCIPLGWIGLCAEIAAIKQY